MVDHMQGRYRENCLSWLWSAARIRALTDGEDEEVKHDYTEDAVSIDRLLNNSGICCGNIDILTMITNFA